MAQEFKKTLEMYCVPLHDGLGNYIGDAYLEEATLKLLSEMDSPISFGTKRKKKPDPNQPELPIADLNDPLKFN